MERCPRSMNTEIPAAAGAFVSLSLSLGILGLLTAGCGPPF
jgi:hypothetical protein